MLKIYLKLILLVIILIMTFGFLAPYLFSAKNTELVMLGGIMLIVMIPIIILVAREIVKDSIKLIKNNKKEENEKI